MAELLNRAEDGRLAGGVQQRCGFIKQEKCGFAGEGAGDCQSLLLPTTERMNRPTCHPCEADLLHQSVDPGPLIVAAQSRRKIEQKLAAATGQ